MELLNRGNQIEQTRQNMREHGAEITADYMAGKRLKALATEWRTSMATIAKTVRANGGEIRPTGNAGKGDRMLRAKQIIRDHGGEIAADYAGGKHMQQLADQWNISIGTIASTIRRHGVTVRKRGAGSGVYTMERNHGYKGGRHVKNGYINVLLRPDSTWLPMADRRRFVLEHRLVMAQTIGRCLDQHETVHHIDNNPLNNDVSNLQLRSGRHGRGAHFVCGDCGSRNVVAIRI